MNYIKIISRYTVICIIIISASCFPKKSTDKNSDQSGNYSISNNISKLPATLDEFIVALRKIESPERMFKDFRGVKKTARFNLDYIFDHRKKSAYNGIYSVMTDPVVNLRYLSEIDDEVRIIESRFGGDRSKALDEILSRREKNAGFGPPVLLEKKYYQGEEWWEAMKKNGLFIDPSQQASQLVNNHGALTHRLQWHVIIRHHELHPQAFGGLSPREIWADLAINQGYRKEHAVYKDIRNGNVWDEYFDNTRSKDPTSPDWFRTVYVHFLPNLREV